LYTAAFAFSLILVEMKCRDWVNICRSVAVGIEKNC